MRGNTHYIAIFFFFYLLGWNPVFAQNEEQEALEAKREQLQKEIEQINYLLFDQKKKKGTVLDQMEALDNKIKVRQELINVTTKQSNILNRKINSNIKVISGLRKELDELKDDYAMMIQKGYQSKIQQSKLMFLLSSDDFYQAFKRIQYIKQYTEFRRKQGEKIVVKTEELSKLNQGLSAQRKEKDRLVAQNLKAKRAMTQEKEDHQALLGTIRKSETKFASQIRDKQNQAK